MNSPVFNPDGELCPCVSYKLKKTKRQPWKYTVIFPLYSTPQCSSILSTRSTLRSPLSLSLVVFCVMEWLLRTWLLCLTLVDEVCLCLSALTCRNRDTAYSKINTQSRRERDRERERGWATEVVKRKRWGGVWRYINATGVKIEQEVIGKKIEVSEMEVNLNTT